jgi:hypothetical protein
MAERFENDDNESQGQLKEILDLLKVKFQPQDLHQRWLRRQVSHSYFEATYLLQVVISL